MGKRRRGKTGCFSFIFCYSCNDDEDNDAQVASCDSASEATENDAKTSSIQPAANLAADIVLHNDEGLIEDPNESRRVISEKNHELLNARSDLLKKEQNGLNDQSGKNSILNMHLSRNENASNASATHVLSHGGSFCEVAILMVPTGRRTFQISLPVDDAILERLFDIKINMMDNLGRDISLNSKIPLESTFISETRFDIMWSTVFSARQYWMRSPDRWFDNGTSLVSSPKWRGTDNKFVFNVKIIMADGKQELNLAFIIDAKTILSSAAFWTFWKLHFQIRKALLVFTENAKDEDRKGDFIVVVETRSIIVSVNLFVDFVSTFAALFGMASKCEGDVGQEVMSSTNQCDATVIRKIDGRSEQSLNKERQNRKMEKHARDSFNKQIQEELKLCRQLQILKWLLEPGNARVPSPVPLLMEEMLPLWKKYYKVCTKFGFQLNDVLQKGINRKPKRQPKMRHCLVAGDEEAFRCMDEIYEQAVANLHPEFTKVASLCPINMVMNPNKSICRYGVLKACLKSVKVSVFRSIKGFRFAPFMDSKERRRLYHLMIGGAESLQGQLVSLNQQRIPNLRTIKDQGVSLTQPKIAGHHQWPSGSALIIGDKKMRKTYVKINFKEHLKMVSVDRDGEIQCAVANALKMDAEMAEYLQSKGYHYSFDPKYGYLNSQLTNIGLGISISIHMIIPHLSKQPFLEDLLKFFRLERKPCGLQYHGESITELKTKIRFATDEVEVLESIQEAVLLFAKLDKNMKNGKKFDHLLPTMVRLSWKQGMQASLDAMAPKKEEYGASRLASCKQNGIDLDQTLQRDVQLSKLLGCAKMVTGTLEPGGTANSAISY